jgi:carbonic anhydrase
MCENCPTLDGMTRRSLFRGAAATAAAAMMLPATAFAADTTEAPPNPIGPDEALQRLVEGNARYVANTSTNKDYSAGRVARSQGQYPFATIVSCSDSRVAPELVFDQGPGQLFGVRVAGNFVNEDGLASIEYGAAVLGAPLIFVLGHSSCGAVEATIKAVKDGTAFPGHLPSLVAALRPAVERAAAAKPADLLAEATIENVRLNVAYLESAKPIVSDMVAAGKVKVAGGVYDIATGKVTML